MRRNTKHIAEYKSDPTDFIALLRREASDLQPGHQFTVAGPRYVAQMPEFEWLNHQLDALCRDQSVEIWHHVDAIDIEKSFYYVFKPST